MKLLEIYKNLNNFQWNNHHTNIIPKTNPSGEKGIIVKGPYECSFSFSKNIRQISLVYDVLVNGKIYKEILKENLEKL